MNSFATDYAVPNGTDTDNAVASGDLYNQSIYFRSDATGLVSGSIEINNTPLMPQPLDDATAYNETLKSLGNLNQDMNSGIHPGCLFSFAPLEILLYSHCISWQYSTKRLL